MLKVLKFGGSSLADAQQFAKVKAIVEADESRRVVIVSAPGKRFSGDHKITDLLYLCAAHIKYGVSCEEIFDMIRTRYLEIAHDCGLKLDLNPDFDALWAKMQEGIEKDELASRGEYFSARLMAEYLGYEFLDAAEWVKFRFDGTVDTDATYEALRRAADEAGVHFVHAAVRAVRPEGDGFLVEANSTHRYDRVIVATGGASYPLTGSTGDGYRFAKALDILVTALSPSLVPLETEEGDAAEMQGLSLKNTALTVTDRESGKAVYTDFGEMLFTHYGVSGPMILSASAHLRDMQRDRYVLHLNFKPALDDATLDARLLADFRKYANRDFANALSDLLPQKLIPVVVRRSGIDAQKKVNLITRAERQALTAVLRNFTLTVKRPRPLAEAIVTAGGVDLSAISPKTMEAKQLPGLYFCGEVLNLDAYTGGFNLQIAFSTGYLAGESAAYS